MLVFESAWKKEKDLASKEIEKLRVSIQTLCRSALPLGNIMDYIQEDVDAMQSELQLWHSENRQHAEALHKEQRCGGRAGRATPPETTASPSPPLVGLRARLSVQQSGRTCRLGSPAACVQTLKTGGFAVWMPYFFMCLIEMPRFVTVCDLNVFSSERNAREPMWKLLLQEKWTSHRKRWSLGSVWHSVCVISGPGRRQLCQLLTLFLRKRLNWLGDLSVNPCN